jgi:hypothetical protein
MKRIWILSICLVLALGAIGCKEEGAMEKAGREIDEKVESAGDAVDDKIEEAKKALEDEDE